MDNPRGTWGCKEMDMAERLTLSIDIQRMHTLNVYNLRSLVPPTSHASTTIKVLDI